MSALFMAVHNESVSLKMEIGCNHMCRMYLQALATNAKTEPYIEGTHFVAVIARPNGGQGHNW